MAEKINLDKTPVIDVHSFIFQESKLTREELDHLFALGGPTVAGTPQIASEEVVRNYAESSIMYRAFIKELSRFLSCKSSTEKVLKARNARLLDFKAYARELFNEAGIKTLLIDNGSRQLREVDKFGALFSGFKKTFRLETLIRDLLQTSKSFNLFLESFDEGVEEAVKVEKCVALKSVIAYRTGLDVQEVSETEAKEDFNNRNDKKMWFGPYVKKLRDFLLRRALLRSIKLQIPVLIHTGLGDTDVVMSKCNVALLADLLRDPEILPAKVVLIHGGFPYTYEAGWLANVLPNVYFELSSNLPPFLEPAMSTRRYAEVLRWVTLPKLVFGSDAGDYPETHWYYALVAKRAMAQALNELVESEILSVEEARKEGENIFFNNAKRLFNL